MKKKGQTTFNNENVQRIKMFGPYPLYSPRLLDFFHQRGKVIDSSPASKSSAPSETKGAYHLTEKSGWGVESIMVSDLPVYRRNFTSVTV